ncbi:MAG: MFS transporter [Acidobacteriaceae bacterium]
MTLTRKQAIVITILVIGYSGFYLCRSNFAVALPYIVQEFAAKGMDPVVSKIRLGTIASLGLLAYAVGKFGAGWLSDYIGGRRTYLFGMLASVACTIAFAMSGTLPLFTLAWIANRGVQSLGWAGIVNLAGRSFHTTQYGTVMGIISLSYLFGDAAARSFMGWLFSHHLGWRTVFFVAAAVLLAFFVLNLFGLQHPEHEQARTEWPDDNNEPLRLAVLTRSPMIWTVCLISVGLTLVRETFNLWTPLFLSQTAGMTGAEAATKSAVFPLVGGVSVLVCGYASDRVGSGARALIIAIGLVLTTAALAMLATNLRHPVLWIALVAFFVIGPYSYLAGALSMDLGGKQSGATVSGLIDGTGYLGGILAGDSVARLSSAHGWSGAFLSLSAICALLTAPAAWFYWNQRTLSLQLSREENA